ncbi:histidine triad domain protein [Bacteriovorax sp. BSW11_IV]|uniref:HIT domain-containing protein n=1 Tax=Bacteriovorax sp. BSW11_IV TaxID=1353529 RepID=UPI000389F7E1|nr:HIT family protein [Bacteriovorax sp. BSW11_IV]EQC42948.1 histidine triad domain protein [Bacteriovorax sp. BSW11_IV]
MYSLHERLENDTIQCTQLELCELRIMPDSECPWVVLIPKKDNVREIFQLTTDEQVKLIKEIALVSKKLQTTFDADKMNVGALGNMVPQLHIHIIARFERDRAWPGALWGVPDEYDDEKKDRFVQKIKALF